MTRFNEKLGTKRKWRIGIILIIVSIVGLLYIYEENFVDSLLGTPIKEKSNIHEMQKKMSYEYDAGFVMPIPDVTSQVAVETDFDGSQESIDINVQKTYDVVGKGAIFNDKRTESY